MRSPDYGQRCMFELTIYEEGTSRIVSMISVPAPPAPGTLVIVGTTAWEITSPGQWVIPQMGSRGYQAGGPVMVQALAREHPGMFPT
jgi:hypothetical protein